MKHALALAALCAGLMALGAMCDSKPAKYGAEITTCLETSNSWAEYEPCCVSVARRARRDPTFCFRDGGAP